MVRPLLAYCFPGPGGMCWQTQGSSPGDLLSPLPFLLGDNSHHISAQHSPRQCVRQPATIRSGGSTVSFCLQTFVPPRESKRGSKPETLCGSFLRSCFHACVLSCVWLVMTQTVTHLRDSLSKNAGVGCHFVSSSRGSSQPRKQTLVSSVSCIGRWILYHCVTWGLDFREFKSSPTNGQYWIISCPLFSLVWCSSSKVGLRIP